MTLGFTKSKVDSNLCFKVEDGNPVMLLLYVDDLFVTGSDGLITNDALLSRYGGVAKYRWNLPRIREVCSRDPGEIQDDGLQGHDHTYGIKPEAIE